MIAFDHPFRGVCRNRNPNDGVSSFSGINSLFSPPLANGAPVSSGCSPLGDARPVKIQRALSILPEIFDIKNRSAGVCFFSHFGVRGCVFKNVIQLLRYRPETWPL